MAANGLKPVGVTVHMYQVGFGDCFLLSFEYGKAIAPGRMARHILIDFGTKRRHPKFDHEDTAKLIREHTEGHLDAVVLTHRHQDHLSGFGNAAAATILDAFRPQVVVRPWTEDPKAAKNATKPTATYIRGLNEAQSFAASFAAKIDASARGYRGELRDLALQQLANQAAITKLDEWAAAGKAYYVSVGQPSGLEELLPGVKISVLGPPTIAEWPAVKGRRESDPEYWMLMSQQLAAGQLGLADPDASNAVDGAPSPPPVPAGTIHWLLDHMEKQSLFALQRVVQSMDAALNNTSVILLFEVDGRRLLFSGDAQIENWEYVLGEYPKRSPGPGKEILGKLEQLDLYKVGHHGSRNATPKDALFAHWANHRQKHKMTSLVSTKPGVFPGTTEASAVPRATLLKGLATLGPVHGTHELDDATGFFAVRGDLANFKGFVPA
jgi:beta-lactamase superfamily II metal-dependent hydrolase